jgi:predicted RNA methylase
VSLQLVLPGERAPLRSELSQWFTPRELATRIAIWSGASGVNVLEPSAGDGSLAKALRRQRANVACIEIDQALVGDLRRDGFQVACGDFLAASPRPFDLVVMNPPYEDDADLKHVLHALEFAPRVIALVRLNFLAGKARQEKLWRHHQPARVAFLSKRPQFVGETSGSPKHDFCVVDISRGLTGAIAELEWW